MSNVYLSTCSEPPQTAPADAGGHGGSVRPQDIAGAELSADQRQIEELRDALAIARARERLLTYELQHHVRNLMGVIRSIYRRTRESGASQEEFAQHFEGRLEAVARYYSPADGVGSTGIEIEDMLRDELLESRCLDGPRCTISGPSVHLGQKSAELIGLAIHELTTNSVKFGAIAQGGALTVTWSLDGSLLRFRWAEAGVSVATSAPRPSGFGRQLIEEALPYQLGATTSFDLKPGGIECSILLPLPDHAITSGYGSETATGEAPLLPSEAE